MSTHTPGPWFVFHGGNEWDISRDSGGTQNIARVHIDVNGISVFDAGHIEHLPDGNADLIAAAPEMYEALKRFLYMESHIKDGVSPIIDAARAAVAKAEGRS